MWKRLLPFIARTSPSLRRRFWRRWYEIAVRPRECSWAFINFGLVPEDGAVPLVLQESDEADRLFIQLYDHVLKGVDLEGANVLDAATGRGGGASYIKRYRGAAFVCGLDIARKAAKRSRSCHRMPGLAFVAGDAENMPLADASMDAVVCVESMHCFGSSADFLAESVRVLRPGGHLLICDGQDREPLGRIRQELSDLPLTLIRDEDLTDGILEAIRRDTPDREARVRARFNAFLRPLVREYLCNEGAWSFGQYEARKRLYFCFALRKNA